MFCEFCGDGGRCAVCGYDQDAAEELRRLDGSLGLDAEAGAADAVHEFAESIETDVRYAMTTTCDALVIDRTAGTCIPDYAPQFATAGFALLDIAGDLVYAHRHTSGRHAVAVFDGSTFVGLAWATPEQDVTLAAARTSAERREIDDAARAASAAEEFERMAVVNIRSRDVGFSLRQTKTPVRLPRDVRQVVSDSRVYTGTRDEIAAKMKRGGYVVR